MITNDLFWTYWQQGKFDKALQCSMTAAPKKRGSRLFQQAGSAGAVIALSAGEFLYDYCMINPTVVDGLDFARSEDLQHVFQLSQFAKTIDTTALTGDIAQLQGYVAEQMIAQQLTAAGHDVEFPETSNEAGWDIRVDGDIFQVKCGASKQIVEAHFEKYPHIPVYVNAELARYYEDHPLVLTTSVSREHVLAETTKTLTHAKELLDVDIPWIAAMVSTYNNVLRLKRDGIHLTTAARNIAADTISKSTMAAAGKLVLGSAGALLMPGAGAIVFPVIGAYIGVTQSSKLSTFMKRTFAKKQYDALCTSLHALIARMQSVLTTKYAIKQQKWATLQMKLPNDVQRAMMPLHTTRTTRIDQLKQQLQAIDRTVDADAVKAFEHVFNVLGRAGIHAYSLKDELFNVQHAFVAYEKNI